MNSEGQPTAIENLSKGLNQFVDSLGGLARIKEDSLNLVILKRKPDPEIVSYIDSTDPDNWDDLEVVLSRGEMSVLDQLESILPESAHLSGRQALVADIKKLMNTYFEISSETSAKVSLSFIDSNMCRLFHVDHVGLRLLCTYHGHATEWLEEDNADRSGLRRGCNSMVIKDDRKIRQLNVFDVGLLIGEAYPGNKGRGVIHRSPSVEGKSQSWRVLLKIDSVQVI